MKIRTGFVSNSSSSSFIIAYLTDEEWIHELITRLIESGGYSDNEMDYCNKKDILTEYQSWYEQEALKKLVEKLKPYSNESVRGLSVSYHDATFRNLLKELHCQKKIAIINEDE
jgi:hypothetical protein